MAQRRANAAANRLRRADSAKSTGDDFDFLTASQGSTGSDDQTFQLAVAQQLMASKEKKRKEQERKFIQAAKNKLNNELGASAEAAVAAYTDLETAFTQFFADYITSEDAIRAIWAELKAATIHYQQVADKLRAKNEGLRGTTEAAQISAMGGVKGACQEYRTLVDSLSPSSPL
ncbi:hypothetical protein MIND_01267900 [Mycena indigotica]|uniref:Uncharacterized protein n=1 Tax=Mycena indigotica TaxID=2126181 RepID=A0A8H6VRE0_9AGAR|nr:uncharacterized protein MIND_01267900 [Mycena indigotica]KAF7291242.1 hypothetical protein MIND_01267900 [Mycena indigotica]